MRQLGIFWENLLNLGSKRLAALGLTFTLVLSVVGSARTFVEAESEILYSGLDREDVSPHRRSA